VKLLNPRYLGDGVYITLLPELDSVMLTTGHHDEMNPQCENVIILGHAEFSNMLQYLREAEVIK